MFTEQFNMKGYEYMDNYEDLFNPTFLKTSKTRPQFPEDFSLAMAYIPLQESLKTYDEEKGFSNGTIFPELNKEFCGRKVDTTK